MNEQYEQTLNQSWTTNADAWTRAVRSGSISSRVAGTDAAIRQAVTAVRPRRVLDVGCGEGWLVRALATDQIEVVGVDGSAPLIEQARALGGGTFHVLSYDQIVADPSQLHGPYAAIVCSFALLAENIVPLLTALHTALDPTGHLIIQTVHPWTACGDAPYRDGWRTETFAAFAGEFREPMPWFFRTIESWVAALREAGYTITHCAEPIDPASGRPLSLVLTSSIEY